MKKIFTFLAVALIATVGTVGCGGAVDNTAEKTNTSGVSKPKDSDAEKKADESGKKRETAAGGQAKTAEAPE